MIRGRGENPYFLRILANADMDAVELINEAALL